MFGLSAGADGQDGNGRSSNSQGRGDRGEERAPPLLFEEDIYTAPIGSGRQHKQGLSVGGISPEGPPGGDSLVDIVE